MYCPSYQALMATHTRIEAIKIHSASRRQQGPERVDEITTPGGYLLSPDGTVHFYSGLHDMSVHMKRMIMTVTILSASACR